jgi:Transglycosylase SLT domain.
LTSTTNKNYAVKKFYMLKIGACALMLIALFMILMGMTTRHSYAATNETYITSAIRANFGAYANQAMNVARCESGLNPAAVNAVAIGNSHASGLFQILYPSTWNTTSGRGGSPFDPNMNARAAHDIFQRDGNSWSEWQCKP